LSGSREAHFGWQWLSLRHKVQAEELNLPEDDIRGKADARPEDKSVDDTPGIRVCILDFLDTLGGSLDSRDDSRHSSRHASNYSRRKRSGYK
jgi:hypothetical protein